MCCVIGHGSRHISLIPDHPDIERMWKCCDKVKNIYFILGFWYGSGGDYGAFD